MNLENRNLLKQHLIQCNNKIRRNYKNIFKNNPNLLDVLNKEFNGLNIKEALYLLSHNIEEPPKCPICGNIITFHNGYNKTCSKECMKKNMVLILKKTSLEKYGVENPFQAKSIKEKIKRTNLEKYGVEYPSQSKIIRQKIKQSTLEHYGVENPNQSKIVQEKSKKTNLERYGAENPFASNIIKRKIKQTNLERYGVEYISQNVEIQNKYKNTMLERYGVENPGQSEELRIKVYNTKKKNHTFNTSKPEEKGYKLLCDKYGVENVKRQYKSELYPFACDFYVKSLDLYIEFNFFWTHGRHRFDPNNKKDIDILNKWKEINIKNNYNMYNSAIITWTKSDHKKFEAAENNKLNYLAFYNFDEFLEWYNK